MESIKIRKVKKEDLKEVAEIFRIETAKKPYFQKWSSKTALSKIKEAFKGQDIFVAIEDNQIAGFSTSNLEKDNKKKAYIDEVWLAEQFQGKGIGRKLMKYIEDYYKNKKVEIIHLVAKRNAGAFIFYKKLNYYESPENVFLEKRIN